MPKLVNMQMKASDAYKPGRLEYPLEDKDKYNAKIQFEIIEQQPPKFQASLKALLDWTEDTRSSSNDAKKAKPRSRRAVAISPSRPRATGKKADLYVPVAHSVTDVFVYDNPALGISGGTLLAGMQGGLDVSTAIVDAAKQGLKGVGDLVDFFGGKELGRAAIVRGAAMTPFVPQKVKDAIGVTARTSLHPNQRTRFQNVGIRKFAFQFKFIPRSRDEAVEVKELVQFFREHAYPEEIKASLDKSGIEVPIAYKYPDMFRIKLYTKAFDNGGLIYKRTGSELLDCFLESITTTYNPTAAVYHYDGEPVETDLTLNFVEHRPLAKSDFVQARDVMDYDYPTEFSKPVPEKPFEYDYPSYNNSKNPGRGDGAAELAQRRSDGQIGRGRR